MHSFLQPPFDVGKSVTLSLENC